jgi:taurine--2-oxoglutarate transaminase
MTLAKGLTGSHVPLAATIVTDEIASYFDDEPFMQGYTYSGHPVACAAGLAAIETYEDGVIERTTDIGAYLREQLEMLSEKHASVVDLRGIGMFHGIELADAPSGSDLLDKVLEETTERGALLFGRNDSLIIAPPLVISREEIDAGIEALDAALAVADQNIA